jgi:hypothetical protein
MKKLTLLNLALILVLNFVSLHAQTAPPEAKSTAAAPLPSGHAPDEMTKKITDLVHAGKYAEAQQLTNGLLIAYPDDQRLIKAKALIEGLLASGDPTSAAPGNPGVAQPLADGNAERLSGMEKVEFNSLLQLARQAQQETAPEQQTALLRQFVSQSDAFLQRHPDQMLLWQLRAVAALGLHDPYAQYIGFQAGQKLIAAGAASSNDPNLQQLLSRLNLMGWLDGQKMEEATKNTADSLTNGMGTKFARVPGTTTVFSIYLTKVGAFQAFVDETHYDACKRPCPVTRGRPSSQATSRRTTSPSEARGRIPHSVTGKRLTARLLELVGKTPRRSANGLPRKKGDTERYA